MLTQQRLKQQIHYEPETGTFTWLPSKGVQYGGKRAGTRTKQKGYYVHIDGKDYRANRLAWLYMTGSWPAEQVDHIDRDPYNDSWANLREATASQNSQNTARSFRGVSGVKGVTWCAKDKRWLAKITCNKQVHELGRFKNIDDAAAAVSSARDRLHGEFACHL